MVIRTHPNFARLLEIAHRSHVQGRAPSGIATEDVARAQLYSYAFRRHVIGAFHATREALRQCPVDDPLASAYYERAVELLSDLTHRTMDPVGTDVRALISTFHYYATHVDQTVKSLDRVCDASGVGEMRLIRDRFVARMEEITTCGGISLTQDTCAPEQASFIVPKLGIAIVPLVYGDFHSWNLAYLKEPYDVPFHRHHQGVEIHLGFRPMRGYIVLGDCYAEVDEGYAMPVPPLCRHGYVNDSTREHHLPFIFGSIALGGWGVFLDVEPQPIELERLEKVSLLGRSMNNTVLLEREIDQAAARFQSVRYPILPAAATDRDNVGGLELSIARVNPNGLILQPERFCIVSVVHGQGKVQMAGVEQAITSHDHFGVPADIVAHLRQEGDESLVTIDAVIKPAAWDGLSAAANF